MVASTHNSIHFAPDLEVLCLLGTGDNGDLREEQELYLRARINECLYEEAKQFGVIPPGTSFEQFDAY